MRQVSNFSMASSSSSSRCKYDVFLSFRGEDTRKTFVDHLYVALEQKGIHTFKDDEKLERGNFIRPELLNAIKESQFALIIFSENYASSSWCLDELVEIMECKNSRGLTVWPVFYHVEPSQVRKQTGSFAGAFAKHGETFWEDKERSQRRSKALVEASNLSGWDLEHLANGHEAKFIQQIVREILSELRQTTPLDVTKFGVGIDARAKYLITLLADGSKDVCMLGICGAGGIGKTTIAKVVFNMIFDRFESCCFLENVREVSKRNGLNALEQELLNELLKERELKIHNIGSGINVIKNRLQRKRVLIVLDDVDHLKQLKSLAGESDWFGYGSKIIITTRDQRLLLEHKIDEIYRCELLDDDEALQLFSWHAFSEDHPSEDYKELSCRAVNYAKGLPLALEVLGSFLHKRSMQEWEAQLDKLKRMPHGHIQDVLRISFDGLDEIQKDIFLDIACFFKGWKRECVIDLLESCGFYPNIEIKVLIERSLITISGTDDTIWMHDLMQDMGKEIVRQESPKDPGKRTRLWVYEDVCKVLTQNAVTDSIEGIFLDESQGCTSQELHIDGDVFLKMKRLRVLKISKVQLCGPLKYLSKELSYLDWKGYPERTFPSNFEPEKLVKLQLCGSQIKRVWIGYKFLEKLKYLNLSDCLCLEETPDFSGLPCLEDLNLKGCASLVEVHDSIGVHDKLRLLRLDVCKNLRRLPKSIKLRNLESLSLNGCLKLEKFPEIESDMDRLSSLELMETGIVDLPPSIEQLNGLLMLRLADCKNLASIPSNIWKLSSLKMIQSSGCPKLKTLPEIKGDGSTLSFLDLRGSAVQELPSSIVKLSNLQRLFLGKLEPNPSTLQVEPISGLCNLTDLDLSYCNLREGSFPNDLGCWGSSLTNLVLRGNNFCSMPRSFIQLTNLQFLTLENCSKLQTLTSLPPSIRIIWAHGCNALQWFWLPRTVGSPEYRRFYLTECNNLFKSQRNNTISQALHQRIGGGVFYTAGEIPYWFEHRWEGVELPPPMAETVLTIELQNRSCRNLTAVSLCFVSKPNLVYGYWLSLHLYVNQSLVLEADMSDWDIASDEVVMLRYETVDELCRNEMKFNGCSSVHLHMVNDSDWPPPEESRVGVGIHLAWEKAQPEIGSSVVLRI